MNFLQRAFGTPYRKCEHLPLYHNFRRVYWDIDNAQNSNTFTDQQERDLMAGKFPWKDCSSAPKKNAEDLGQLPSIQMDRTLAPHIPIQQRFNDLLETERPVVLTKNWEQWNRDVPRLAGIEVAGIIADDTIIAFTTEWIQRIFLEQPRGLPSYAQGHDRVIMALYGDLNNLVVSVGEDALCAYFRKLFLALEVMLGNTPDPAHFLMLLTGSTNTIVYHSDQLIDRWPYFTAIVHAINHNMDPITLATNIVKLQNEMETSQTLANIRKKLTEHDIYHAPGVDKCLMYRRVSSQKHRKSRGQQSSRMSNVRTGTARRPYRSRDRGSRKRGSRDLRRSNTSAGSRQRRSRLRRR